jgi:hypothetical protein
MRSKILAFATLGVVTFAVAGPALAVNPQPLPPRHRTMLSLVDVTLDALGAAVLANPTLELNPQPLPPRERPRSR